MRIGIDIRELERGTMTGIGRYLCNFLGYVAKNDRRNEYILFGNQKTVCKIEGGRFKIKIIPEFFTLWWDQKILSQQIKKENIQLFYSPYFKGPSFSKDKLIVTIHDLYPFFFRMGMRIKNSLLKFYIKKTAIEADKIITVSSHMKNQIVEVLGINSAKVEVIYNSVSEIFSPLGNKKSTNEIRKLGIEKDFFLYVGNLKPHKNLINLVDVYDLIPSGLKEKYHLVIVGEKDRNYGSIFKYVQDKGLRSNIIFTDLVDDRELLYLYNSATIFITTSLHEGFGIPIIEAMTCGLPVIGANTSAIPEVIADAGMLVNPYDKESIAKTIVKLVEYSKLRNELIQKGINRAKDFSVKLSAEKLLNIFKEVYYER